MLDVCSRSGKCSLSGAPSCSMLHAPPDPDDSTAGFSGFLPKSSSGFLQLKLLYLRYFGPFCKLKEIEHNLTGTRSNRMESDGIRWNLSGNLDYIKTISDTTTGAIVPTPNLSRPWCKGQLGSRHPASPGASPDPQQQPIQTVSFPTTTDRRAHRYAAIGLQ